MTNKAYVVGAGLAGCEAAFRLAESGVKVTLFDIKPHGMTPAHHSEKFGELVCSNSLRSDDIASAAGLIKEEMRRLGSLVMRAADKARVAAGGALAVDRAAFEDYLTGAVLSHPNIEFISREVTAVDFDAPCIVATGPLTTDGLSEYIQTELCSKGLSFYDAAAPIVTFSSIDRRKVFFASRYEKGGADYINCPMTKDEYLAFYQALVSAETAELHGFEEDNVFEGCLPIEVMAKRGVDTIRYGPLKPVGLIDPRTGCEPYAAVQLRLDNKNGTLYNIVGFQTHLKFGEQKRVFSMIPGLENAEFARYGVMHRNTFLDSPRHLDCFYRLKKRPDIMFAGQMTGVEGYIESASSGLYCGLNLARILEGKEPADFTAATAVGALAHYVSDESVKNFQPMNITFGIMNSGKVKGRGRRAKRLAKSEKALEALAAAAEKYAIALEGHDENNS